MKTSERLLLRKHSLLGDMLLSTAFITYLGAFDGVYREQVLAGWKRVVVREDIQVSEEFRLEAAVGQAGQVQQWGLKGLPQDSVSIENMLIMEESKHDKWPLIIDPQG